MASPNAIRRLMGLLEDLGGGRFRYTPSAAEGQLAARELSGATLTPGQQIRRRWDQEVTATNLETIPQMRLLDEIDAARAARAGRPTPNFSMDPEAIAATEDRFAWSDLIRPAPRVPGTYDLTQAIDEAEAAFPQGMPVPGGSSPSGREWHELPRERRQELLDINRAPDLLRDLQASVDADLRRRRGVAPPLGFSAGRGKDTDFGGPTMGFSAGGGWRKPRPIIRTDDRTFGYKGPRAMTIQEEAKVFFDALTPQQQAEVREYMSLDSHFMDAVRAGMAPSDPALRQIVIRMDRLGRKPHIEAHLGYTGRWDTADVLDASVENDPITGFAAGRSSKGGFPDDDASKAGERNMNRFSKANPEIDRRMDQITSQLIQLEDKKASLPPEQYQKLRSELVTEARRLEMERAKIADVERTAQIDEKLKDAEYDYDIDDAPDQYTPGRADMVSHYERKLRDIMDESVLLANREQRLGPSPEIDAAYEALKERARPLEEALREARKMPMGAGKQSLLDTGRDALRNMMDPQLGRAPKPSKEWASQYVKGMRFLPLERPEPSQEELDKYKMPDLMKRAMGLGGQALEILDYADPVSQAIGSAMFLGPVAAGQKTLPEAIAAPGTMGSLPRHRAEQAELMRQRRSTREKIEEHRRQNAQLRP